TEALPNMLQLRWWARFALPTLRSLRTIALTSCFRLPLEQGPLRIEHIPPRFLAGDRQQTYYRRWPFAMISYPPSKVAAAVFRSRLLFLDRIFALAGLDAQLGLLSQTLGIRETLNSGSIEHVARCIRSAG